MFTGQNHKGSGNPGPPVMRGEKIANFLRERGSRG